jgi:hypothetical protein
MKRTIIITGIIAGAIIIAMFLLNSLTSKKDTDSVYAEAKRGLFEITVSNSGELEAERSVDIKGPEISQTSSQGRGGPQGPGGGICAL